MSSQPLTHHEILALIEPFSRQGYQADLPASQRLDRRLQFRPLTHALESTLGPIVETLALTCRSAAAFRLERRLAAAAGPSIGLVAEGAEPAVLLERVRSVPLLQPFAAGPGFSAGFGGRVAAADGRVALSEAVAHVGEWRLTLEADPVRGMPAEVALVRAATDVVALPEDLLAVLGRDWGLLRPAGEGWSGSVRLRGRDAGRDARTRERLLGAARHLAATFAEPAARFHAAHRRARWVVTLRRLMPLAVATLLLLAGLACTRIDLSGNATLRVLLMSSPPVLMILFFSLRDVPRFELPAAPRPSNAGQWPTLRPTQPGGPVHER